MSQLSKTFKVDGTATAATSAVLGYSTSDYGIKRNDTGATVVDSATAMTAIATGQYNHTFTDPADDLTYTWRIKIVYAGRTYKFQDTMVGSATAQEVPVQYADIWAEVSRYLGTGASPTGTALGDSKRITQHAWREFLMGLRPGTDEVYDWTFLRTKSTLTITTGSTATNLPSTFESMQGNFMFGPNAGGLFMEERSPGHIYELYAAGTASGIPQYYAIEPVGFSASATQRYRVITYPAAGSTTTFHYHYRQTPDALSQQLMGMPTIHDAVMQLARARAAEIRDDISPDENPERILADRYMLAAIGRDSRNKPQRLGYNSDNSDVPRQRYNRLGTRTYDT